MVMNPHTVSWDMVLVSTQFTGTALPSTVTWGSGLQEVLNNGRWWDYDMGYGKLWYIQHERFSLPLG